MKNKIFIIGLFVLFLGMLTVSCSKDDNYDLLTEETDTFTLNKQTQEFKDNLLSTLNAQKIVTKSNDEVEFTKEQVTDLRNKSLDMFASHGFKRSEFKEFLGDGDERIILMATIFTAIIEQEPVYTVPNRIKTRSESSGGDDGTCWSKDRVISCLSSLIGLGEIGTAFNGIKCITKSIAKVVVKNLARSVLGAAAVAITVLEFTICMGW